MCSESGWEALVQLGCPLDPRAKGNPQVQGQPRRVRQTGQLQGDTVLIPSTPLCCEQCPSTAENPKRNPSTARSKRSDAWEGPGAGF